MAHDTFQLGDLTAVIGDNSAEGDHKAGYNGIWSLHHRTEPANLFVPGVAGLNLEHIFDGSQGDYDNTRKIFFEPRNAPMSFQKLSDTSAELHQPPTPTFQLESWTKFELVAPHSIDMRFRFVPTQHAFEYGYIGLFWANYINAPDDKSIYFRNGGIWQQMCSQRHNDESTVRHRDDHFDLKFRAGLGDALYKNFSPLRFEEPFFYGLYHNHLYMVMFDRTEGIRMTHSPSGGGMNKERQTSNPAWDFQYILPRYEVVKEYQFRVRAVYREKCNRAQVLQEFEKWRQQG
jgi:hypothetical protein